MGKVRIIVKKAMAESNKIDRDAMVKGTIKKDHCGGEILYKNVNARLLFPSRLYDLEKGTYFFCFDIISDSNNDEGYLTLLIDGNLETPASKDYSYEIKLDRRMSFCVGEQSNE